MTYRRRAEFSSNDEYAVYVRENISVGMRVRCCQTYEEVSDGDTGIVVKVTDVRFFDDRCHVLHRYNARRCLAVTHRHHVH